MVFLLSASNALTHTGGPLPTSDRRSVLVLFAIVLATTTLTACGSATADLRNPVIPKVTAKLSSAPPKPARPQELTLDGKQPCDLLSRQDWPRFFIEKGGKLSHTDVLNAEQCLYNTNVGGFGFILSVAHGINYWTQADTAEKIYYTDPVEGFPALERPESWDQGRCDIIVDVADGQFLLATASTLPDAESKLPPKCVVARQLAEIAINALVNAITPTG